MSLASGGESNLPERHGKSRRAGRILVRLVSALVVAALIAGIAIWLFLRASLPPLDGERRVAGITARIEIERDGLGVPTVTARNRTDLAFATGFLHGQDRFFQMDLMRRRAAGELAELVGAAALPLDRKSRVHRFRMRARGVVDAARPDLQRLVEAYAQGVGAGLESLRARPFEYLLLGVAPRPWLPEDCVLVAYAMWFTLTDSTGSRDARRGMLEQVLPRELVDFVDSVGTRWDAALDGSVIPVPPVPGPDVYNLRRLDRSLFDASAAGIGRHPKSPPGRIEVSDADTRGTIGSNNWAVSGSRGPAGRAWLANDMHLPLEVPNTWYRIRLVLRGAARPRFEITGVSLPGAPMIVAGSNGFIAWGFTNSYGDWTDLVTLDPDPADADRYLTPAGSHAIEEIDETIPVKGATDVRMPVRSTRWGPVIGAGADGRAVALRWLAHERAATNFDLLDLEQAVDTRSALEIAARSGIPPQNFVVADHEGSIGWTVMGRLPTRARYDARVPRSSADGGAEWTGWLDPADYPRSVDPESGVLWTANNRVVGGEALWKVGCAGYAFGARARQIHSALQNTGEGSTSDMLAIQLDDRARYLDHWHELLLDVLRDAAGTGRAELRSLMTEWDGRAAPDSASYRLLRGWQARVRDAVFSALTVEVRARFPGAVLTPPHQFEGTLWQLMETRPAHLLDPSFPDWEAFLLAQADALLAELEPMPGGLRERTWGEVNEVRIRHPMSRAMPILRSWLDMETVGLPGDHDVPRVQRGNFGASQRFAVSPGRETEGYFHMPAGQSGHPLSPWYRAGHEAWVNGEPLPFLPGAAAHTLMLHPAL
ncbi:penicillin acylase family protein [soil metagenome]